MSFKVGDFVTFDVNRYCIVQSVYYASTFIPDEFEEMHTIKVISATDKIHIGHIYEVMYCNLDKIIDKKLISKLNKLITFE